MRPSRILAVAARDLRIEFAGRRGWAFPLIAVGVLVSAASLPPMPSEPLKMGRMAVKGDVPAALLAESPDIYVNEELALLRFEKPATEGAPWRLHGLVIPESVRTAMDRDHPPIHSVIIAPDMIRMPDRSLFLALVAASVLTGAISQSIPGERSNRTLETLLVAGITSLELVVGKWFAWTAFGGGAAVLASIVAIALGHQEPGWWMLAAPMVSAGTVALGLWLVRRANDVVGGATVALRVLPAALIAAGILAWMLGDAHPYLGASVPLGGALIAAGSFWPGPVGPLLAVLSTGVTTAVLLTLTARDLADPERPEERTGTATTITSVLMAAFAWWGSLTGPLIWAVGGNKELVETLSPAAGARGAAYALLLLVAVQAGRSVRPLQALQLWAPRGKTVALGWMSALAGALVLGHSQPLPTPRTSDLVGQAWLRMSVSQGPFPDDAIGGPLGAVMVAAALALFWDGWLAGRIRSPVLRTALALLVTTPIVLAGSTAGTGVEALTVPMLGHAAAPVIAAGVATALSGGSVIPALVMRVLPVLMVDQPTVAQVGVFLLVAMGLTAALSRLPRAEAA